MVHLGAAQNTDACVFERTAELVEDAGAGGSSVKRK